MGALMTEVLTLIIEPATTLVIDPDLGPQPVPAGAPGQIVSYGPDGALIAMDLPAQSGGAYDDTAIVARVDAVEGAVANLPRPYDDSALVGRVVALEEASVDWTDITNLPVSFPPAGHRHDASEIDNLPAPAWATITGRPTSFPPSAHIHQMAEIEGLQAALDAKQPATSFKTVNGQIITGAGDIAIPAGNDGISWTITVVTTQAAYDAATPGPHELVVRI